MKGDTELARTVFDAQVIPSVAYTHPEVAWVGYTEDQAKKEGRKIEVARFPWAASGRAIANGADYGFTKLLFDAATHRIIGGAIVGPSAGDMISEVCLAIEMGCDAIDIGRLEPRVLHRIERAVRVQLDLRHIGDDAEFGRLRRADNGH